MCLFFHKWGKWSILKEEKWINVSYYRQQKIEGSEKEFTKFSQIRICTKCGKTQKRYMENE